LLMDGMQPMAVKVLTPGRMDGLAMGAVIAVAVRSPTLVRRLRRAALLALLVCGILIVLTLAWRGELSGDDPPVTSLGFTVVSFFWAGLLTLAVMPTGSRSWRVALEWNVLRFAGRYSYGLYVYHPIVTNLLAKALK